MGFALFDVRTYQRFSPLRLSLLNQYFNQPNLYNSVIIYHVTTDERWRQALQLGVYTNESLQTDGFIHGCLKHQVPDILDRHFADSPSVILLHIVQKRVKKFLKWADVTHGYYPHLHGKVPLEAISDLSIVSRTSAGDWDLSGVRLE